LIEKQPSLEELTRITKQEGCPKESKASKTATQIQATLVFEFEQEFKGYIILCKSDRSLN
jgi:hypothetical protein